VLRQLQELPGFSGRFEELPRLPEAARHWSWLAVLRVRQGEAPGSVQWCWVPAGDVDETLVSQARATEGHSTMGGEGDEELLVPVPDPRVEEPRSFREIDSYHETITRFARHYLLNAEWSPRAVHAARQASAPIQLPQAPPREALSLPTDIRLDYSSGDPIGAESVDALLTALGRAGTHPAVATYRIEDPQRAQEVVTALERAAAHKPNLGVLATRFAELQAIYARAKERTEPALEPNRRDAMWAGAVEHVRLRLADAKPPNSTPSANASRAKRYLNAAVNGTFDSPIPAEPSDSPEYFTRWRSLLLDAAKALAAWRKLSEDSVD
jgi:hypothetical protein